MRPPIGFGNYHGWGASIKPFVMMYDFICGSIFERVQGLIGVTKYNGLSKGVMKYFE
jgi:hypothetical protein